MHSERCHGDSGWRADVYRSIFCDTVQEDVLHSFQDLGEGGPPLRTNMCYFPGLVHAAERVEVMIVGMPCVLMGIIEPKDIVDIVTIPS